MKSPLKVFLFGILLWLIPFILGFIFWPLHATMLTFFESLMIIFGSLTAIILLSLYFRKVTEKYLSEGIAIGVVWFALNILLDIIFLVIMFKNPFMDYLLDTGSRYLIIPIMSIGIGYILSEREKVS